MSYRSSLALLKVPYFAPTLLAMLLAILAEAVALTYTALLAVEKIGMTPIELTLFMTLSSISGIGFATLFGQMHDRRPARWPLLLSLLAKVVGYGLCAVVSEAWMLIAIGFTLFGLGGASFGLLFAIAKGQLDVVGGETVQRGMASMRMISSLAWAIGPAIGAVLVAFGSFRGVYLGASGLALVALVTVLATRLRIVPAVAGERRRVDLDTVRAAAPGVLALTAFHTAMFMASTAMSIVVVQDLGTETDVGLLFSLCAALEVLVMGLFVIRPMSRVSHGLLIVGFLIFAAYFVLPLLVPTLSTLYWGQILRAIAIGVISIVGMAYIQELLPGRAGAAAALFGNTMSAGALLSGLSTGLWAGAFGFWSIFGLAVGLSLFGAAAIAVGRRGRTAEATG
ncbi:MFS transporter [Devosia sp. CN2-171]|uniref:MFS transporter n=1 Tax=Devosia sp. CN2-171 TaxID=3400909 RepID=UPI003BF80725